MLVHFVAIGFANCAMVCGQGIQVEPAVTVLEDAVSATIATAEKSVVAIARGPKAADGAARDFDEPFPADEYGTGVVIDADGLVLTNYHLLGDPKASSYAITLDGKKFFPANIKAADPWTDLAVLEIQTTKLTPIQLAPNAKIRKGKFVVAIGNPYGILAGGSPSASFGIVSNLSKLDPQNGESRTVYQHDQLIKTDGEAMIGGSGGPLVDLQGRMIGLVTSVQAIAGYDQAGNYAIRVDDRMLRIVDRLKSGQAPEFGFLGVNPQSLSEQNRRSVPFGVKIGESNIFRHTPAAKAGLQLNDIITHFAGSPVHHPDDLVRLVSFSKPSEKIQITVRRADPFLRRMRIITRDVLLAKRPATRDRVSVSTVGTPDWRGIRVDFVTVSNDFYELASRLPADGAVLVISVEKDSIAWQSGVRDGDLIVKVNKENVSSPSAFQAAVGDLQDDVACEVIRRNGSREIIAIPASLP